MAKTMKAAVVREFGKPLTIDEVPIPEPGPGMIQVRVQASGVCHTDLHAAEGDWPVKPNPPFIPGHEGVGFVSAVGQGVKHVKEGDRMWSCLPFLRPMATVTEDTLEWYGIDEYGASVHAVIGTRCDPYTHKLLSGGDYHHCCHSNLTNALAEELNRPPAEVEGLVHDVLNVFMCTGFSRDTGQYLMKASPVRPGDYLELFAEIDLIGGLSACPGGDCGAEHSSDAAPCHPLLVEIFAPAVPTDRPVPQPSPYRWP